MAHLDEELQRALAAANEKINSRSTKKPVTEAHLKKELISKQVAGEGERFFSDVFGFDAPSGIDHTLPAFQTTDWNDCVREYIPDIDYRYIFPPEQTEEAVVAIKRGKPLLVTGGKGSGKTSLQREIAARLCMPWFRVNARGDMESSGFFGTPDLSKGELGWIDGPLPLFGKFGGIVTIDEVSATPSGIALALQSPLEPNGPIYIPEKPKGDRYIKPHPWFRITATDNTQLQGDTTGRYAGTNVQNEALIDRFLTTVKLDYLSKEHETSVVKSHVPNIPDDWLVKMLDIAQLVRRGYDSGNINFTLSPRGLVSWAEDAVYWGNLARSFRLSFMNKLIEDDAKQLVEIFMKVTAIDLNKIK